jgi:hypothetical protein
MENLLDVQTVVKSSIQLQIALGLKPAKLVLSLEVFEALNKSVLNQKGLDPKDFEMKRFEDLPIEVIQDVRDMNEDRDNGFWNSPIKVLNQSRVGNTRVALANMEERENENQYKQIQSQIDDGEDHSGYDSSQDNESLLNDTKNLGE